jgi:hypothetical protein
LPCPELGLVRSPGRKRLHLLRRALVALKELRARVVILVPLLLDLSLAFQLLKSVHQNKLFGQSVTLTVGLYTKHKQK